MSESKPRLFTTPLEDLIHNSMIPYAEYVIMDRAIPRVEDGLKPVQRRVLYTMYELGNTPDKPTKKSARIVGDCLGKFHPHGDTSVYGALVRLAQDFNVRNVLVDGQGNFGSVDGDGAAAMRYTEARLSPLALELLRDIEKDTVDFTNNFDDTLKEPLTLPGRFPNLLVNGAYGIAVGLATNIPTHNLGETIDGCIALLRKPDITLKEMLKHIKGPDFPTGGYIMGDIEKAYETGKGKIFIKAKCKIEQEKGRESIVITELPYQVNKSVLQQKIIALREDKHLKENEHNLVMGIQDVVDESDVNGVRIVIKVKKDYHAQEILDELYKRSDLTVSFNINMVAIAGGKPKQLSLLEILSEYVKYQIEVIVRRSKYEYNEAKDKEHILEALVKAVQAIDEVVEIIKTSKNTAEARVRLMQAFDIDTVQAQAILDLRLARLTSLEVFKLEKELEDLRALIKKLDEIIRNKDRQKDVLIQEMLIIKKKFADPRRSTIIGSEEEIVVETPGNVVVEDCVIYFNGNNEIRRAPKKDFTKAYVSLKATTEPKNLVIGYFDTKSDREIRIFTDMGNCYKFMASDLPYTKLREKANPSVVITKNFEPDEKIINVFDFTAESEKAVNVDELIFCTKLGAVKRSKFSEYEMPRKDSFQAIKLAEGDSVISVDVAEKDADVVFVSEQGMGLRFKNSDIPLQGRVSMGVKGMILADNDKAIFAGQTLKSGEIFVISNTSFAKRVLVSFIPETARARKGVKMIEFKNKKVELLIGADYVTVPYAIGVLSDTNEVSVISTEDIKIEKRETRGKPLTNVNYLE